MSVSQTNRGSCWQRASSSRRPAVSLSASLLPSPTREHVGDGLLDADHHARLALVLPVHHLDVLAALLEGRGGRQAGMGGRQLESGSRWAPGWRQGAAGSPGSRLVPPAAPAPSSTRLKVLAQLARLEANRVLEVGQRLVLRWKQRREQRQRGAAGLTQGAAATEAGLAAAGQSVMLGREAPPPPPAAAAAPRLGQDHDAAVLGQVRHAALDVFEVACWDVVGRREGRG